VTSNFVLDELLTLLARRASYEYAARRARVLLASHCLKILRPDESIELAAVAAFEKYADQKVSFTDCTSFVLMRSHGLQRAFTFDRHFALAGFEVWPAPS
jgi:predicted nucleic acid-binding protein